MSSLTRILGGAARAQLNITRHNIEDLRPIIGMPLVAVVALGVLVHSGKSELAPYALVAAVLMTIGQMGNFVADRFHAEGVLPTSVDVAPLIDPSVFEQAAGAP